MRISILDISRAGYYEERSQAGCLCSMGITDETLFLADFD